MDQDRFREIAEGDGPAVVRLVAGVALAMTGFEDRSGDLAAMIGPLLGTAHDELRLAPLVQRRGRGGSRPETGLAAEFEAGVCDRVAF